MWSGELHQEGWEKICVGTNGEVTGGVGLRCAYKSKMAPVGSEGRGLGVFVTTVDLNKGMSILPCLPVIQPSLPGANPKGSKGGASVGCCHLSGGRARVWEYERREGWGKMLCVCVCVHRAKEKDYFKNIKPNHMEMSRKRLFSCGYINPHSSSYR